MKKFFVIGLCVLIGSWVKAEPDSTKFEQLRSSIDDTIAFDNPILKALDSLVSEHAKLGVGFEFDSNRLNTLNYPFDSVPPLDSELIQERLAFLDENTPFALDYNNRVHAFINLYANKRKELTEKMLGLSAFYFPLFEEVLVEYDLPLEFKYLAVVESALNPTARSRAGAVGLWQFMYATGKIYDLNVTSYEDERMDPIKSTKAACEYFSFLYGIYQDWNLVLAAYNCGPGNVNKAIRRSGYRRDYWTIYRYLPRETRGYVPAFIAVNYIMNYASEHNIYPQKPTYTFFDFDTVLVNKRLRFEQVAAALDVSMDELRLLNPSYKRDLIPYNGRHNVLRLPKQQVGLFVLNEETIYDYDKPLAHHDENGRAYIWEEKAHYHRVRSGEFLGSIANRYGVRVSNIMEWNNLRSTTIHPGRDLVIYKTEKVYLPEEEKESPKEETAQEKTSEQPIYYQVQEGDTLWDIAKEKGISVEKLKEANKNLNDKALKPGAKIVIPANG